MLKNYYHATPYSNLSSIIDKGVLVSKYDRMVYLTDSPESAATFVAIRGCRDILVVRVLLEEDLVKESFDHNQAFFRCRAYTYPEDISKSRIKEFIRYELDK